KCDAARPQCGQCARTPLFEDCEYPDGGVSSTQLLEDQISSLEGRIERLQSVSRQGTPHSSWTPSPSASQGQQTADMRTMIQNFLRHSSQFGFFLNVNKFQMAIINGVGERPTPVLVDVVSLWAIHLSNSESPPSLSNSNNHEATYLSTALRSVSDALSGTHTHNTIIHSIQAAILLSQYFIRNNRFLEGKYHLTAAISLVVGSGLHRIRAPAEQSAFPSAQSRARSSGNRRLPPPRDALEEAERVGAFWTALRLDSCWTTVDGSANNLAYNNNADSDVRIDTPWPLDIDSFDINNNQILATANTDTIGAFLANHPDNGTSATALHAKATILFDKASRLGWTYRLDLPNRDLQQFYAAFTAIDTRIESFKLQIPPVEFNPTSRELLLVHCLAHAATIQLHSPLAGDGDAPRLRVLDTARAVVRCLQAVPLQALGLVDPIMGPVLALSCQVFITELRRLRRHRPADAYRQALSLEEGSLRSATDSLLTAMAVLAPRCPLMDTQLRSVQQAYQGLG
ncbi:fungal-trans domain-containing protein, partial [Favolaschia claudopus]